MTNRSEFAANTLMQRSAPVVPTLAAERARWLAVLSRPVVPAAAAAKPR